jgi:hypothetical protein
MTDELDDAYARWMQAEAFEQACLVMLGVVDSVEMHAAYERAVERVEAHRDRYELLLGSTSRSRAS